ncbi:hypothetical protein J7K41_02890 [Candidatus Micrarchaeota archaeon]|nr:hypothetical protein [Candidatus Micrarchaeota archaeon]
MFGTKKGQAAMEYLMTYGWALLVIIIVLAILLIILGGYLRGTPSCTFEEAGFVCNEPAVPVMDENGVLYGAFQHAQDEPINITGIACVEGQVASPPHWDDVNKLVPPRQLFSFGNLTTTPVSGGLQCYDASGNPLSNMAPGSQFRGQLWIKYNYKSDAALGYHQDRTAVATVIANVEKS